MTPQRWAEVDKLLDEAMARLPEERATFLDAACSDDDELRREVDSLLNAHQKAEEKFLKLPAIELAARRIAGAADHSLVGQTLSHYSVVSILGIGGMGEVYLARDTRLARKVALKFLPPHYTEDAARIKRFEREARSASALNHPNIITIYEIGKTGDKHFIAAEYIDGQTLRELLSQGRMAMKETVEIALQIASALAAAHEAGIVHRDIKPENVMLRRDGYVKVVDFGLVKLTEHRHQTLAAGTTNASEGDIAMTNPGAVLGTIRYMSPEQALGQDVDPRSDVFSLGVVLYELLVGVPPFKGDRTAATLDAIVHHAPVPITQVRPDLHPELGRIVGRMLEKDRDLRFQTASDLRSELRRLQRELDSSPLHSSGPDFEAPSSLTSHAAPTVQARSSNAKLLIGAATILVALAAVGLAAWRILFANETEPSPWLNAYTSQITDFPGEERNPSLSPDGKTVYYSRRINGQWDIFWQRIGGSNPQNLTGDSDDDDSQPICSPDGTSIVFRSERNGGGLFVMGATGENVRQISSFGQNPSWSPDGTQIVCGTDYILDPKRRVSKSALWVINLANDDKRPLPVDDDAAQPQWSPGGHRIAYYFRSASNQRDIWTIAAGGGQPLPVTNDEAVDWNPVWSGDGKYLYFASDRKGVASLWRVRIDEASGRTLGQPEAVTGQTGEILQMDLSHDGRQIVYATRIQNANLQSIGFDPVKKIKVGEPVWVTQGSRPSGSPNVSPDGQRVVFHSLGAPKEDIWLVRSDGIGTSNNLTNDDYLDRSPRWSPDGNLIAFFSTRTGMGQIWLINPDGSGKRQLTFSPAACSFPFWSPDGQRVAYQIAGNSHGTQIIEVDKAWDQQTLVDLPPVNSAQDWFKGFGWSPDGKLMVGAVAESHDKEVREKAGIYIYSLETKHYEKITDFGARPEWLNDSRHILFTHQGKGKIAEDQVWLVDSLTKAVKPVISHPTYIISTLGVSRDNRRIFFTATAHQADIFLLSLDK